MDWAWKIMWQIDHTLNSNPQKILLVPKLFLCGKFPRFNTLLSYFNTIKETSAQFVCVCYLWGRISNCVDTKGKLRVPWIVYQTVKVVAFILWPIFLKKKLFAYKHLSVCLYLQLWNYKFFYFQAKYIYNLCIFSWDVIASLFICVTVRKMLHCLQD